MKAQARIISEFLIFCIGIVLVIFVWNTFSDTQTRIKSFTITEQLSWVADEISFSIAKLVSIDKNATLKLLVPKLLFDEYYVIKANETLILKSHSATVRETLFGLGKYYNISGFIMSSQIIIPIHYNGSIYIGVKHGH